MDFVVAVNNFGDTRSGGLAGPMGLFIIVLMAISTVLLIRNMNKRLRRLPDSFPDPAATERAAEIARLDADLQRSGATPRTGGAAAGGSEVAGSTMDAEVKSVEPGPAGPAGERPDDKA
ncbi:hypothetical protein GCM10020358_63420 [Amorphoplanes nipponensis]|uniref:Uncharacterized protein n=1 Tax=Actinoplanes nipponensis TaxID=135950 RepID=A0A919JM94_9ACTN|nr:hypothetical protein [Actinoplanes nipponensis]GIE52253.1 hypothetical protein Ani05nite_57870 [Actinoplanes nipponensis]